MRIGLAVSLTLLAVWIVLSVVAGEEPWLRPLGGLFGLAIVGFGVVVLFGGRCPRCGLRLAPRPPLDIPGHCPRCGATLSRSG